MGRGSNYLVGVAILASHVGSSHRKSGLSISPQNNHRGEAWNILAQESLREH